MGFFSRLRTKDAALPPRSASSGSRPDNSRSTSASSHKEGSPSSRGQSPQKYSENALHLPTMAPLYPPSTTHSPSSSDSEPRPHSFRGDIDDLGLAPEIWGEVKRSRGAGGPEEGRGARKVTFRSPAPTPTASLILDEIPPLLEASPAPSPSYRSRRSNTLADPARPTLTTRKSSLPASTATSLSSPTKSSILSPTPSDASSARSYLPPPNTWSEMAEDDLIANLGPRERTRQEVLWEIVSSEERYVQELIKLSETFATALLPPSTASPNLSSPMHHAPLSRTFSPLSSPPLSSPASPTEPFVLPIAARYATTTAPSTIRGLYSPPIPEDASPVNITDARRDAYNTLTNGRPGIPKKPSFIATSFGRLGQGGRSHQSLPPPRSMSQQNHSRTSYHPGSKLSKDRVTSVGSVNSAMGKDLTLPEDLQTVLRVLSGEILEGHVKLAEALRKRYESQYPLVRSLADVFTAHSYILKSYSTYVFHLESALSTIDTSIHLASSPSSKRLSSTPGFKLGKTLLAIDDLACEKGESGLSTSLSKPFQRLLKYPLLFQNLLFNTDPSLREYEKTLEMVDEVEAILHGLEDERADWEKRKVTRDMWARIEGLEKDKMLMAPKSNRLLEAETPLPMLDSDTSIAPASGKALGDGHGKKSFRRLSEFLKHGEKRELWVVRFSDVSLLCDKIGSTSLPLTNCTAPKQNSHASRSDSLPELSGKGKYATAGRRGASIRMRNLYRFVKVHEWHLKANHGSTDALVSKEEITKIRRASLEPKSASDAGNKRTASPPTTPEKSSAGMEVLGSPTPTKIPLKGDGPSPSPARTIRSTATTPRSLVGRSTKDVDADTVVSDRLSVMSFAFTSDNVRPIRARQPKLSAPPPLSSATHRVRPASSAIASKTAGKAQEAKFGGRLRNPVLDDAMSGGETIRPTSRTRRSLPPAMANSPGLALRCKSPNNNTNARVTPLSPSHAGGKKEWTGKTVPMKPRVAGSKVASERKLEGGRGGSDDSGVAGLWSPEMAEVSPAAHGNASRGGRI